MEHTEKVLATYDRLLELGLSPVYARRALGAQAGRLAREAPEDVARDIFDSADPEWKAAGFTETATGHLTPHRHDGSA